MTTTARADVAEIIESVVIEYSVDGGTVWHHGRTCEAWVWDSKATLADQRAATRENARQWHGAVESVTTRVITY